MAKKYSKKQVRKMLKSLTRSVYDQSRLDITHDEGYRGKEGEGRGRYAPMDALDVWADWEYEDVNVLKIIYKD